MILKHINYNRGQVQVIRSKKTGLYYGGNWHGETWQKTPEYCKKFTGPKINDYFSFLDSKGFEPEIIPITKSECYK